MSFTPFSGLHPDCLVVFTPSGSEDNSFLLWWLSLQLARNWAHGHFAAANSSCKSTTPAVLARKPEPDGHAGLVSIGVSYVSIWVPDWIDTVLSWESEGQNPSLFVGFVEDSSLTRTEYTEMDRPWMDRICLETDRTDQAQARQWSRRQNLEF